MPVVQPPGPALRRVRLVDHEQRARAAGQLAERVVEPVARGGRSRCSSARARRGRRRRRRGASACSSAVEVVELDDLRRQRGMDGRPDVPGARPARRRRSSRRERLVDGAVVAPVEDEHLRRARSPRGRGAAAKRFASVAVSANCQNGRPKRRASSSPTQAASSVGSIAVEPRAAWAAIAGTTGSGACPAIAPVSPRQRSTYSWPSTSTTRAPFASCDEDREAARPARHPAHRDAEQERGAGALAELERAGMRSRETRRSRVRAARPAGRGRS